MLKYFMEKINLVMKINSDTLNEIETLIRLKRISQIPIYYFKKYS